jgi:CSLREA domain-containing protein
MRASGGRVLPRGRRVLAVTAAAACLLGTAPMAPAAARPATDVTFRVTTTADAHDPNPGDGHCADAAGQCTLRAAIEEAGAAPAGTDISISVPAGRYLLTLGTLTLGARSAPVSMTIRGTGAGGMVISAGDAFRVMRVTASATVVLDGLVIADGSAGLAERIRRRRAQPRDAHHYRHCRGRQPGRGRRRAGQLRRVARADAQPDPGQQGGPR